MFLYFMIGNKAENVSLKSKQTGRKPRLPMILCEQATPQRRRIYRTEGRERADRRGWRIARGFELLHRMGDRSHVWFVRGFRPERGERREICVIEIEGRQACARVDCGRFLSG